MFQIEVISFKRMLTGFALSIALTLLGQTSAVSQALYPRAPDVIPGTLPEMRTIDFWVARMESPDKVVMTLPEIRDMDEAYRQKMRDFPALEQELIESINNQMSRSPGLITTLPDIGAQSPSELSSTVHDVVRKQIQHLQGREYGSRLAVEYSEADVESLVSEFSETTIPEQIKPVAGIAVENSLLRIVPSTRTEQIGLTQAGKSRWDLWNLDIVKIGSPLQILHTSKSGGFLLVLSDRGYGWVASTAVALSSADKIKSYQDEKNFIVVTGDRVPFYSSAEATYVSGWLRMGDRLPLASETSNRQVRLPVRKINGELSNEVAWLAPDADVNIGYLPYTRRNVVAQSFKLLDNVYDWTGGWFGRNHATSLRDIFSTFGFDMPSNGVFLAQFNGHTRLVPKDQDKDDKYETIFESEPFLTFITSASGHSELYLGNHDGQVITFDTHGYGYENDSGETLEIRRWGVSTLEFPAYMLRQDIILTEIR